MSQPIKIRAHVGADHLVRLPSDIPEGPVELIVIRAAGTDAGPVLGIEARRAAFGRFDAAGIAVPDDFDAPLPDDVLADFDGESR